MADTRFTGLGLSGSGKTCYVLGMYYEMCVGLRGFTLTTTNQTASKLENWMDELDEKSGKERFPAGTSLTEFTNYSFMLNYHNEPIMSFDWNDYGGRTLHSREDNQEVFEKINDSIDTSTALYIFVDGDLMCKGEKHCQNKEQIKQDRMKRLNNVKRKCARSTNSYISSFVSSHEEALPPIIFVITKADLCKDYLEDGEMEDILKEAFSSVFGKGTIVYAVAVSLGNNISDDNYSGEVEPVNIHIPFFLGIFHEFLNRCLGIKKYLDRENNHARETISQCQSAIDHENNRWFFTDYNRINQCAKQIQEENLNIAENEKQLQKYRMLLNAVANELVRSSAFFKMFLDGKETEFTPPSELHSI